MSGPYSVLMVDPPWPVGGYLTANRTRATADHVELPYNCISLGEIGRLLDESLLPLADTQHCIFLWLVERYLHEGEQLLTCRSYRLHTRFVWDKGDGTMLGTVRRTHEYLSWFYIPPLLPIARGAVGKFPTVIRQSNGKQHSRKPSAAYAMVEALYPDARRLDAFTREYRPGWDGWGLERDKFTPLLAPLREEVSGG